MLAINPICSMYHHQIVNFKLGCVLVFIRIAPVNQAGFPLRLSFYPSIPEPRAVPSIVWRLLCSPIGCFRPHSLVPIDGRSCNGWPPLTPDLLAQNSRPLGGSLSSLEPNEANDFDRIFCWHRLRCTIRLPLQGKA
jgi:hypothetical protein